LHVKCYRYIVYFVFNWFLVKGLLNFLGRDSIHLYRTVAITISRCIGESLQPYQAKNKILNVSPSRPTRWNCRDPNNFFEISARKIFFFLILRTNLWVESVGAWYILIVVCNHYQFLHVENYLQIELFVKNQYNGDVFTDFIGNHL